MTSTVPSDAAADGDLPLVTGMPQRARENMHWRELMTDVILKKWSSWNPSRGTKQAEDGLGIEGTPRYFYAMRTDRAFGIVVFFFREVHNVAWPADAYGATPFDSGGLWHDKICTDPPSGSVSTNTIFREHQKSLMSWKQAFKKYIASNYDSMKEYIMGNPPGIGSSPIIPGSPNSSRAWTWEVRIPRELTNRHVELLGGFLSDEDRSTYLDWLWYDSNLDDVLCRSINLWMQDKMQFAPPGILPSKVAEQELLGVRLS